MSIASIIMAGAKWEANAKGRPSAAATWAPNRLEPRIHNGTLDPTPGTAMTCWSGGGGAEVAQQFDDIVGELVRVGGQVAPQRAGGRLVGSRRAAESQVDTSGKQGFQRAELLGNHQGGMVGQHDAAGPDPNPGGAGCDVADHHGGGRAGDSRHAVVLGQPVAPVAQGFRVAGQIQGIAQGLAGIAAAGDGGEVEDGEWNHGARDTSRDTLWQLYLVAVRWQGRAGAASIRSPSAGPSGALPSWV